MPVVPCGIIIIIIRFLSLQITVTLPRGLQPQLVVLPLGYL